MDRVLSRKEGRLNDGPFAKEEDGPSRAHRETGSSCGPRDFGPEHSSRFATESSPLNSWEVMWPKSVI